MVETRQDGFKYSRLRLKGFNLLKFSRDRRVSHGSKFVAMITKGKLHRLNIAWGGFGKDTFYRDHTICKKPVPNDG